MISDAARTVDDAMATIHPSVYDKLIGKLRNRAREDIGNEDSNAEKFLCGVHVSTFLVTHVR